MIVLLGVVGDGKRGSEMRTRNVGGIIALTGVFIWSLMIAANCAVAAEFSADIVMKPKGEPELKSTIHVKDKKIRHELSEDGETQIIIFRPDKQVIWTVIPEEKMYIESPTNDSDRSLEEWTPEKEKKAKSLGEETISGYPCKKYEIVEDGEKTTYWVSNKFPYPIKIEDEEAIIEYRNIKEGTMADSLFEVPAGYEKMSTTEMPGDEEPDEPEEPEKPGKTEK